MIPLKDLADTYSNEQLFLLQICRMYFSGYGKTDLNAFVTSQPPDWQLVYKIAMAHGIRPFIYDVILKYDLDVDTNFRLKLENDHRIMLQRNMMQAIVTAKITADLKDLGITVIAYKGAALISRHYDNMGMRESIDIDLIASRSDIARIEDYFINSGYIPKETVPRRYLKLYQLFFKDMVYHVPKYDCNIEVHWSLLNGFAGKYPTFEFFNPHIEPYKQASGEYIVLSPSFDFLATISNHLVKDMNTRFKYIIDIACILKKDPALLDDSVILSTATKFGFKKRLIKGLSVVSSLTGVDIAPSFSTKITREDLLVPLQYPVALSSLQFNNARFLKRSLSSQDNTANKAGFLLRSFAYFFIPSYIDINTFRLPIYLFPLLFILRPFRLLLEKISLRPKK
ncbi:nucleotidyltransferase domain-containing protein [Mucilaginibacter ginsenosidivorans]|uniref:Nucleotidyltransferase family protein n=1 Tax=Mucilaginibacter ginsenosidivorans TaxID=398053 RepID=A0A5B8UST8_9SPHI|nr:nucleotidyltransferase family protein [Mucilaginibacter ginsenosidivorans]QEC62013.1 nucleotidyltransferase family protein [Mucilaginibacter ginsenosidivorans]